MHCRYVNSRTVRGDGVHSGPHGECQTDTQADHQESADGSRLLRMRSYFLSWMTSAKQVILPLLLSCSLFSFLFLNCSEL